MNLGSKYTTWIMRINHDYIISVQFKCLGEILASNLNEKAGIEENVRNVEIASDYTRRLRNPNHYPIRLNSDTIAYKSNWNICIWQ